MNTISKSPEQTKKIVKDFLKKLEGNYQATVVCLKGDLGAGKTTFVKFAAESLGVKKHITSPTFVILKTYRLQTLNFKTLIHIDAYRLKNGEELENLGWGEIIKNPENLIFIEWPENVADLISEKAVIIELETISDFERSINIKWPLKKKKK